jgi:hypothetical protein
MDLQPGWVSQYVPVGRPAVRCPVGTVSTIPPSRIEAEAGNNQKNMSTRRVNRDPVSWAMFPILPKLVRRVGCLQPPNRMQDIRGCSGAIVS